MRGHRRFAMAYACGVLAAVLLSSAAYVAIVGHRDTSRHPLSAVIADELGL